MTSTAIFLAAIGISLTFAPDNITRLLSLNESIELSLILQMLGAVYFAFAMLNWMAKGAIIGGIYNRPIASANLSHFLIGGIALMKVALSNNQIPFTFLIMAGFYIVAACVFGLLISRHPSAAAA